MKQIINYLGHSITTKHYSELSDLECDTIRDSLRRVPDLEEVKQELVNFFQGKNSIKNINDYFFRDLRRDTRVSTNRWTANEIIDNNDMLRYLHGRIKNNSKTFSGLNTKESIEMIFRTGGAGVTKIPGNFKPQFCDQIFEKFNINNNYYDPSCGWGVRMLSSMRRNINYYGTDPNYKLCEKLSILQNLVYDFKLSESKSEIRCQGSETLIPEYKNKMGLVFTSPPYFNLEDYKYGNQSILNRDYNSWLKEFMFPTICNCLLYLIDGGFLVLNIKNINNYNLWDDCVKFATEELNMNIDTVIDYSYAGRKVPNGATSNKEQVMVLKK